MDSPGPAGAPPAFARALREVRGASLRPEVAVEEVPPPRRLAPWALALSADVTGEAGEDAADGRFVLLHDPAGQEGWVGPWRVVVLARCEPGPELGGDPVLASVAWSWLEEALEAEGVRAAALGGTVTRAASTSFGELADRGSDLQLELRASWSPGEDEVGASLRAWGRLLCTAAGLPPRPEGVVPLPPRA